MRAAQGRFEQHSRTFEYGEQRRCEIESRSRKTPLRVSSVLLPERFRGYAFGGLHWAGALPSDRGRTLPEGRGRGNLLITFTVFAHGARHVDRCNAMDAAL